MKSVATSTNGTDGVLCVAGADLDPPTAGRLTPGDRVVLELNGRDAFLRGAAARCPLLASAAWVVESVDMQALRVRREVEAVATQVCELPFDCLVDPTEGLPAVFAVPDGPGGVGPTLVIPRYLAFRVQRPRARRLFQPPRLAALRRQLAEAPERRRELLVWLAGELPTLETHGWWDGGIRRLALRSRVPATVVQAALQDGEVPDEALLRIAEQLYWLPPLRALSTGTDDWLWDEAVGDGVPCDAGPPWCERRSRRLP